MCKAGRYIWFMAKISSDWDFEFPNPRWRKLVLWALTDRWAPKSSLVHLAKILTSVDFGVQREGSNLRNRQKQGFWDLRTIYGNFSLEPNVPKSPSLLDKTCSKYRIVSQRMNQHVFSKRAFLVWKKLVLHKGQVNNFIQI